MVMVLDQVMVMNICTVHFKASLKKYTAKLYIFISEFIKVLIILILTGTWPCVRRMVFIL